MRDPADEAYDEFRAPPPHPDRGIFVLWGCVFAVVAALLGLGIWIGTQL